MSRKSRPPPAARHPLEPTARGAGFPVALRPLAKPLGSLDQNVAPRALLRPQRPLHEAAHDAQRRPTPSGLGLDSTTVRARMIERLHAHGVQCEPVLVAMQQVPRHRFVDPALAHRAYQDTSLPIGFGQTISKPSVVAHMIALLLAGVNAARSRSLGRTLEVGTGCGYQAAVLCQLATQVVSIERVRSLFERARDNLSELRDDRLRLVHGDGTLGHAPNAPYDSIIASACGHEVPPAWLDQLAIGGRLVAPISTPLSPAQALIVIDRNADGLIRNVHDAVMFVLLKSGVE